MGEFSTAIPCEIHRKFFDRSYSKSWVNNLHRKYSGCLKFIVGLDEALPN
ncbi:MAG: hypothetical protein ACTSO4_17825 [Promethearchaeota archaeon]